MAFVDDLSPALRSTLEQLGTDRALQSGETLIAKGAVEASFYLLREGVLQVVTPAGPIAIPAGEVVGEIAFLDNRPRTATVQAAEPCRVQAFERQVTFQALGNQPLLLNELISTLAALQRSRLPESVSADQRSPTQFVDALADHARSHRAVRHPYLQALAGGDLPDLRGALADFATHYYGYSAHFPRYLTAVISRLVNSGHRQALLENLTEESGQYEPEELAELATHGVQAEWIVGIPHPELFSRFRQALGVANTGFHADHLEVVCWREMFLDILSNGSPAEALGALGLGTETIVQTIYQPFVAAIDRLGDLNPADSVFFPLHTAVDDHHQATLKAIAADFAATPEGRNDLAKGMHKALALRDAFWSWLHERAQAMPSAG
jgi:CRP-like cAMP-binding protein